MSNKKMSKREKDIKGKLMAAIAMLLVSSIMMVSTTYAWFTLSTAPEVTGITTTIGSNGNLEIALSPVDGDATKVGNANMTTGSDWTVKNLTWGNLLDMSPEAYNLSKLTLAPAKLVLDKAVVESVETYSLGTYALGTPHYGSDGRISSLVKDASIGGTTMLSTDPSYKANSGDYGVRAVGTTSGMSTQALGHKTYLSEITSYANAASAVAGDALQANGNALASIMVAHAMDKTEFKEHVGALQALTGSLSSSVDQIDNALRSGLKVMATSIEDEAAYQVALETIDTIDFSTMSSTTDGTTTITSGTALETIITQMEGAGVTTTGLKTIIGERNTLAAKIKTADDAAKALPTDSVSWENVYNVVKHLMNTDGVTINGNTVDQIKEHMDDANFLLGMATDTQIELRNGSGVYYDIAEIAGNIAANTSLTVDGSIAGLGNVTLPNVTIKTVMTGTPTLAGMKTALGAAVTPAGNAADAVMDAYYGYVIDLMLRTNAADSNLLLQTEGAQRVYSDSANENTQGKGACIIMQTTNPTQVATLQRLCESIGVVFFDPSNGSKVMGVAKATRVVLTNEVTGQDAEGNDITTTTITGYLSLCANTVDENGYVTIGDPLQDGEGNPINTLCALKQNVPQAVSALVYLNGENVTSADVLADANVEAKLNLQFASSAKLVPMDNSELFNGESAANGGATTESTGG